MKRNKARSAYRLSALASAITVCLLTANVHAQTNVTGNVFGQVQAGAGLTVVVENLGTRAKRTIVLDSQGRFAATALPVGSYKATLIREGKVVSTSETIEVRIGQGSEVQFASSGATQTVLITGKLAQIDVSSTNNGASFTSKQLDSLPVAQNIQAIVQLAPNTTRADSRYPGGASFGGAAPSENSYYINGFPVTNPLNQLGSTDLPFGAISQAQVLTGGFGVEFGRSIGGVVNITTKSGTNAWQGGVSLSVAPNSLRSKTDDLFYPDTGEFAPTNPNPSRRTDGTLYLKRGENTRTETILGAYVGGPIIQDKLFFFAAIDQTKDDRGQVIGIRTASNNATAGWADRDNTNTRYFTKVDWNITNDHIVEFSLIGDKHQQDETRRGYDYATGAIGATPSLKANYTNLSSNNLGVGSDAQVLRYTGYLTQDLTVTALAGRSKSKHLNEFEGGPPVSSNIRQSNAALANRFPGFTYNSPYALGGGTTVLSPGSQDVVDALRFDLEYKLGNHTLRAGVDDVKLKSKAAGEVYAGNGYYLYASSTNGNLRQPGTTLSLIQGNSLSAPTGVAATPTRYYYGREIIFNTVTDAQSTQSAQYIEDRWQVTKDLIVTPGLRFEQYKNINGDGETFLKVNNSINPRLALSWDASGDASTVIKATAGRYGVQIPTRLAVRGASRSTFTSDWFSYQGVDANGAPTGVVKLGTPFSNNNEYGQAKDPNVVSAQDIKPNSQDEFTLGIERALSPALNVGARATYRQLVATIDDHCDARPFEKYAADNNISTANWAGYGCASFNPGQANTFLVDYAGNKQYTRVNLSAADLGFEKAKRTYLALDFFAEHPLKNGWYGKVSYTYAQNKGNTEGQTNSDLGQLDVSLTVNWDHPELMQGGYGYLPNDRRHQIKAYGFYRVMPELDVGANLLLASGRPKGCLGNFAGTPAFGQSFADFDDSGNNYGNDYRYCRVNGSTTSTFVPRGSLGTLPWDTRLDMNLVYKPTFVKGLTARVDVFNVFNKQTVQNIDEQQQPAYDPTGTSATSGRTLSLTTARSVKLTVGYEF